MLFLIQARNEASRDLKSLESEIGGVVRSASKQPIDIGADVDLGDMLGQFGSLQGAVGALGKAVPVLGGALAGLGLAAGAMTWGRQAAEVQALERSFNRLAGSVGTSGASMLASMKAVSSGMISDMDLMLAANSAMALGVADSAEEVASLLEVAIAKGAEFGIAPTQAFGDLINGLGRMSPEILNNIGIVINAEQAYNAYAAELGTTAAALNEAQRMQALVNATLAANPQAAAQAAAAGNDGAAAFARWNVATAQFSATFGAVFLPAIAGGLDLVTRFVNAVGGIGSVLAGEFNMTPEQISQKIADVNAQIAEYKTPGKYADASNQIAMLEDELAMLEQAQAMLVSTSLATADGIGATGDAAAATTPAMGAAGAAADSLRAKLAQLAGQASTTGSALQSAWLGAVGALGASQALAGYNESMKRFEALTQVWNTVMLSGDARAFAERQFWEEENARIADQVKLLTDVEGAQKNLTTAVGATASAYDGLVGKVQGLVSQALTLDVEWPGKDGGGQGGGDAINENAKRLAAIANEGLIGQPWLEEFAAEAPGTYADLMLKIAAGMNPQGAAQQLMAEFQAGMRPDLLDKGMIKDRVRQMLLGESNTAQIAQEIAAELASELNVSLGDAQAAVNSTLGITAPGGEQAQAGLQDGLAAATDGKALVEQIAGQMEAAADRMRVAGNDAGQKYGIGFMATVETSLAGPLISLLVTLVTPGVMAAMAAQAGTTGAK
jgi:hypothetical protein